MSIITIGIDLAKNIFAVHGVNENGKAELVKPKLSRDLLLPLVASSAVPNRHGSLLRRTPLGTPIPSVWSHHQTHGPQVGHTLPLAR